MNDHWVSLCIRRRNHSPTMQWFHLDGHSITWQLPGQTIEWKISLGQSLAPRSSRWQNLSILSSCRESQRELRGQTENDYVFHFNKMTVCSQNSSPRRYEDLTGNFQASVSFQEVVSNHVHPLPFAYVRSYMGVVVEYFCSLNLWRI